MITENTTTKRLAAMKSMEDKNTSEKLKNKMEKKGANGKKLDRWKNYLKNHPSLEKKKKEEEEVLINEKMKMTKTKKMKKMKKIRRWRNGYR